MSFRRRLVQPLSTHQDQARKEHIFYILIISNLYLSGVAALLVINNSSKCLLHHQVFHGASPWLMIAIFITLFSFYTIAKQGKPKLSVSLYLVLLWSLTVYTSFRWGAMLYQALLMHALIIVFTGILINTRVAFITTIATNISIFLLTYLQSQNIIVSDQVWRQTLPNLANALVVSSTLGLIALFSWLSNREISNALSKAQRSQRALQKERDTLEIRVQERTRELQQAQLEKLAQARRFADMGKISSGLFHDIRNYLTTLTIDLELEKSQQALDTIKQINTFVSSTQKQLKNEDKYEWFSPQKEIKSMLKLKKYAAQKKFIRLRLSANFSDKIFGPISVFHQIIINLVSNAIDAYPSPNLSKKKLNNPTQIIKVNAQKINGNLIISVIDTGCGMNQKQKSQLFNPFYSTKKLSKGTGIGLFLTKRSLEHHFQGKVSVTSRPDKGSIFTVSIPLITQTTVKKS